MNLIGGPFLHHHQSSCLTGVPILVKWVTDESADISIHIDHSITSDVNKNKKNYAWICESRCIIPNVYNYLQNNIGDIEKKFDLIFTHDISLLKISPKMRYVISSSSRPWVELPKIYQKNKLISMISSGKELNRHYAYRNSIATKFRDKLDLFGRGFNNIESKHAGLNDYFFSIAMENDIYPIMFTEKISDCFATGTIPIYYGDRSIGKYFNLDGVIFLNEGFDIGNLSTDLYYSKMSAIKENFKAVMSLPFPEDFFYKNYIYNI